MGSDRSMSMSRASWLTIVVMGPVAAAMVAVYLSLWSSSFRDGFPASGWWAALAFVVGVVVHEGIHGAVWAAASGRPSAIRFGFQLKSLTPYAHSTEPMSARAYRIGALAPGILLGVLPYLVALAAGSAPLALFGAVFTSVAGGDVLVVWRLRGVAPGALVEDHPTDAGAVVLEEASRGGPGVGSKTI